MSEDSCHNTSASSVYITAWQGIAKPAKVTELRMFIDRNGKRLRAVTSLPGSWARYGCMVKFPYRHSMYFITYARVGIVPFDKALIMSWRGCSQTGLCDCQVCRDRDDL